MWQLLMFVGVVVVVVAANAAFVVLGLALVPKKNRAFFALGVSEHCYSKD